MKTAIHVLCLGYLITVFSLAILDRLGADPVESLLHATGLGSINLLMVTLCISPLAQRLPCGDLIRCRRLVGLYCFSYALAHFAAYLLFELQLDWTLLTSEIIERPYITVGFTALMLLLVLAATSPNAIQRRLRHRWQTVHNFVYLCAALGLLHYTWSLKTLWGNPLFYWAGFVLLMSQRKSKLAAWSKSVGTLFSPRASSEKS
ncbi:sulfite oxidase heme-binding subunit YedZ [Alteromonas aestuariivivens]|uniref:sulfite oxidase heme-binding subunit YedZ n=1 Tax=Alteromonas aestuariivivens TaxID=1938339 RepID=UPI0015F29EBA|nr:protein-methionine-sulfoxide reductase heme-binding subunit MsrQ [Alteromonas aestuariivivens]